MVNSQFSMCLSFLVLVALGGCESGADDDWELASELFTNLMERLERTENSTERLVIEEKNLTECQTVLAGSVVKLSEDSANLTRLFHRQERRMFLAEANVTNLAVSLGRVWTRTLDDLEVRVAGSTAIALAEPTAAEVWVRGGRHGSGSYVEIGGSCFIATCRHLVAGHQAPFRERKVRSVELAGAFYLNVTGRSVWDPDYDLALIPVECHPGRRPLTVSDSPPLDGTYVYGYSYIGRELTLVYGKVMEKGSNKWHTDTQGAAGFSGTGYLNGRGELVAVHTGQAAGLHPYPERSLPSNPEFLWLEARESCRDAARHWASWGRCFDTVQEAVETSTSNARTVVAPASPLIGLATK